METGGEKELKKSFQQFIIMIIIIIKLKETEKERKKERKSIVPTKRTTIFHHLQLVRWKK